MRASIDWRSGCSRAARVIASCRRARQLSSGKRGGPSAGSRFAPTRARLKTTLKAPRARRDVRMGMNHLVVDWMKGRADNVRTTRFQPRRGIKRGIRRKEGRAVRTWLAHPPGERSTHSGESLAPVRHGRLGKEEEIGERVNPRER